MGLEVLLARPTPRLLSAWLWRQCDQLAWPPQVSLSFKHEPKQVLPRVALPDTGRQQEKQETEQGLWGILPLLILLRTSRAQRQQVLIVHSVVDMIPLYFRAGDPSPRTRQTSTHP